MFRRVSLDTVSDVPEGSPLRNDLNAKMVVAFAPLITAVLSFWVLRDVFLWPGVIGMVRVQHLMSPCASKFCVRYGPRHKGFDHFHLSNTIRRSTFRMVSAVINWARHWGWRGTYL